MIEFKISKFAYIQIRELFEQSEPGRSIKFCIYFDLAGYNIGCLSVWKTVYTCINFLQAFVKYVQSALCEV